MQLKSQLYDLAHAHIFRFKILRYFGQPVHAFITVSSVVQFNYQNERLKDRYGRMKLSKLIKIIVIRTDQNKSDVMKLLTVSSSSLTFCLALPLA